MDNTIIEGKGHKTRSLAEALKASRGYLIGGETGGKTEYICIAIAMALKEGKISDLESSELNRLVRTGIDWHPTLASYLHNNRELPECLKLQTGYDLSHPVYLKIRNDFLDGLRHQIIREEAKSKL